ncbi:MAG: EAL domain-containing protein [Ewingella sp.]
MRVRRSLTIKQMAAVSSVAVITLCIFIVIQLFHFVQQRRDDYAQQLENIAHSVRLPLSQAVLDVDLNETQDILNTLRPVGILSRAEVVLPSQITALSTHFPAGRPVPEWAIRGFNLPVTISVPLYSAAASPTDPKPLAYLQLQADPYRMYQFMISALSTMLTTYLLLALILSISISWCINRLVIKPLRAIARELEALSDNEIGHHQLSLPARHDDDEFGMLIRSYNRNQLHWNKTQQRVQGEDPSANQQGNQFEPALTEKIQKRLLQEDEILHAVKQNDFTLFIQPQVNMATGAVVGAEALLRRKMADGSYGLESDFIVRAEEIGVMDMLGYKVLELGCSVLARWQQRGITLPLSVNLSGIQVQQPNFLPELRSLLSRYKINPGQLVLEITETARIEDLDRALSLLGELRAVGVSIELDDFGLGYSGLDYLNHLRSLPIDVIKIDRSFVSALPDDDVMVNIVASIGKAMNIKLIAEGVETEAQRRWLLNNDILFGQGYFFSTPLPQAEFERQFGDQIVTGS